MQKFFDSQKKGQNKFEQKRRKFGAKGGKDGKQQEKKRNINEKRFEKLFTYTCDKTKGRNISSIDINPFNSDLIVACYGGFEVEKPETGMICLWTLKSPKYPERIIHVPTRITACKFSNTNPNLLATGDYNGVISIYDIRSTSNKPIVDSSQSEHKHIDAVWELQWVKKGIQDNIVSISSDGRIVEWTMKKKFEHFDLMQLKRQHNYSTKEGSNKDFNFRRTIGFSFDFIPDVAYANSYLAVTEDGNIHLCSKTYTEQVLKQYTGHQGPVYKVRCNPFVGEIFLTCSADWSCKLWNLKDFSESPFLFAF